MSDSSEQRSKGGRPSVMTPQVRERIIELVRKGNYRKVAAMVAGVSERVVSEWMTEGERNPDSEQGEFARSILEAEGTAETVMSAVVWEAGKVDPDHAWKWLARKAPDRWAETRKTELTGKDGDALSIVINKVSMDDPSGAGDE